MAKAKIPKDLQEAAMLVKVLSDLTRMNIVALLANGKPMSVGALCDALKLPQPSVSHHLSLLRMAKVVEGQRAGKQVIYSVHSSLSTAPGLQALKALVVKLAK
jgi:DNA-binding transcriptional ArsR family regulator